MVGQVALSTLPISTLFGTVGMFYRVLCVVNLATSQFDQSLALKLEPLTTKPYHTCKMPGKKIIRTARRSISRDVFCAWAMMLPALSIAVALGLAAKQWPGMHTSPGVEKNGAEGHGGTNRDSKDATSGAPGSTTRSKDAQKEQGSNMFAFFVISIDSTA